MKDGSPREAPKDLFSSFETKPPSDGSSSIPSEELDQEESDPDEDSGQFFVDISLRKYRQLDIGRLIKL